MRTTAASADQQKLQPNRDEDAVALQEGFCRRAASAPSRSFERRVASVIERELAKWRWDQFGPSICELAKLCVAQERATLTLKEAGDFVLREIHRGERRWNESRLLAPAPPAGLDEVEKIVFMLLSAAARLGKRRLPLSRTNLRRILQDDFPSA
jgi:hypothetical protein